MASHISPACHQAQPLPYQDIITISFRPGILAEPLSAACLPIPPRGSGPRSRPAGRKPPAPHGHRRRTAGQRAGTGASRGRKARTVTDMTENQRAIRGCAPVAEDALRDRLRRHLADFDALLKWLPGFKGGYRPAGVSRSQPVSSRFDLRRLQAPGQRGHLPRRDRGNRSRQRGRCPPGRVGEPQERTQRRHHRLCRPRVAALRPVHHERGHPARVQPADRPRPADPGQERLRLLGIAPHRHRRQAPLPSRACSPSSSPATAPAASCSSKASGSPVLGRPLGPDPPAGPGPRRSTCCERYQRPFPGARKQLLCLFTARPYVRARRAGAVRRSAPATRKPARAWSKYWTRPSSIK